LWRLKGRLWSCRGNSTPREEVDDMLLEAVKATTFDFKRNIYKVIDKIIKHSFLLTRVRRVIKATDL